jgi:hypothetical protein
LRELFTSAFAVYDWKVNKAKVLENLEKEIDWLLRKRSTGVFTVRLSAPAIGKTKD